MRKSILVGIVIIIVVALVAGNFVNTTTQVASASFGGQTMTLNATCHGFSQPTFTTNLSKNINVTTSLYGYCLFGFFISNGHPFPSSP